MPDLWMDVDTALSEVPVNIAPLVDDTDFKTREDSVAYNASGLELIWHFTTTAGATSATVVTPTTGGDYDWAHQDGGMYTIEIPASGGASINNDTEGFGWFTGVATGVLPWRGPTVGFRAAGINNTLIDGGGGLLTNPITATVDTATNTHTPTITEFECDDITEATTNHYKGRRVRFTSGNLAGQSAIIVSYEQVGGIGQFTVTPLTEAPANDDQLVIEL